MASQPVTMCCIYCLCFGCLVRSRLLGNRLHLSWNHRSVESVIMRRHTPKRACLTKCSVLDVATIIACSTSSAPNTFGLVHVVMLVAGFTQYGRCVVGSMNLEIFVWARRIARQRAQYLLPSACVHQVCWLGEGRDVCCCFGTSTVSTCKVYI